METYPGIWPGIVENRIGDPDPREKGRLQIRVSQLHGEATAIEKIASTELPWARPCVPFAGKESGMLMLPEVGTAVWIMFVGGDSRLPVWLGCYYGVLDNLTEFTAAAAPDPSAFVLKTPLGHKLVMNDAPLAAETLLESASKLTLKALAAATLTAATIAMTVTSSLSTAFVITAAVGTIQILGSIVILGVAGSAQKLCNKAMMDLYNAHTHTYNIPTHVAGTGPTSIPVIPAAENTHTTSNVRAS